MTIFQWLCIAFMTLAGILIALNWLGLIGALWSRAGDSISFTPPFLAGVAGSIAALAHGEKLLRELWFLPLILDPSIGLALLWLFTKRGKTWLQVHRYIGK